MRAQEVIRSLRREVEDIRAEYVAHGRGEEFDRYVDTVKSEGRWPFDD